MNSLFFLQLIYKPHYSIDINSPNQTKELRLLREILVKHLRNDNTYKDMKQGA